MGFIKEKYSAIKEKSTFYICTNNFNVTLKVFFKINMSKSHVRLEKNITYLHFTRIGCRKCLSMNECIDRPRE